MRFSTASSFIRGTNYWAFQEEAAAYLGVKRTIGVANGTDALVLALEALGVGPGDEVICPAFTFYATAESVARRGATPVFADIDPATLNLDVEDTAAKVTDRTRAIIPVHLFGRMMDVRPLLELGVPVLEDAAQAFGAPEVAQHGAISTFSFYPDEEPLLPRRRRPRRDERRGARRARQAPLVPRLPGQDRLRARRLQLAPRRAAGRVPAHLPAGARGLERGAPRRGSPLRRARPRRARRDPAGRAGPRLPPLRLPLARARRDPRGADRGGHRVGDVLHDAAPPAAVPALPRLRARLAAGDRAGGRGELLAAALARDPRRGAGARRRRRALGRPHSRLMRQLLSPHRLWQLLVDGRSSRSPGGSRSSSASTTGCRPKYSLLFNRTILLVVGIKLDRLHRLRLLQPLVALRLDPRHVGDRARRRRRVHRRGPDRLPRRRRCTASACRGRSPPPTSCSRSASSWARASSPARRWSARA